jgi:hypothetical protein
MSEGVKKLPVLSLILCSRNDSYMGNSRWRLETTLNYIADQVAAAGRFDDVEVLVADWGSEIPLLEVIGLTPAAARIVSFLHIPPDIARPLQKDSPFPEVLALNAAARRVRGAYIGRIDQDTLVGRRFLEVFFDLYEGRLRLEVPLERALLYSNRRAIPYAFAVRCPPYRDVSRFLRMFRHWSGVSRARLPGREYWTYFVGIWLIHRALWTECGGYDERFIYYNWMEVEMIMRLRQKYALVNFGKLVDNDFYHLEHVNPRAAYGTARPALDLPVNDRLVGKILPVDRVGNVLAVDQVVPYHPNASDWGLAGYRLQSATGWEAPPPPEDGSHGFAFAVLLAQTMVQVALDKAYLSLLRAKTLWSERTTGVSKEMRGDDIKRAAVGRSAILPPALKVTQISELPPLPASFATPVEWDLIEGLNAEEVQGSAVVSGQRIQRLVAVGINNRHALSARFCDLAPGGVYRVIAWVKAAPGVRVMIEARDSRDPQTGNPSNYGVARFDLATGSVVNSILASGVEGAAGGWLKVWVDLRSKDGQIFALIGLLEGPNNQKEFAATGQNVIFGGFEISLPRVVHPLSQVGSPSPRTNIVTKVTTIGELPPLPESSAATNGWDLIEGLSAEMVAGPAVVSGLRILRLVAVGVDNRHALSACFGDLAPGGIYRAIAWVKAQLGARVMIEVRDSRDPHTGEPSNYGVARFDLGARTVVNSTGDMIASGVEVAADGWVKLWIDLRSRDGQIFALIGLLEAHNNRHVFAAVNQWKQIPEYVIFGGFEISPR